MEELKKTIEITSVSVDYIDSISFIRGALMKLSSIDERIAVLEFHLKLQNSIKEERYEKRNTKIR